MKTTPKAKRSTPASRSSRPLTSARDRKVTKVSGTSVSTRKSDIFGSQRGRISTRQTGRSATSAIP